MQNGELARSTQRLIQLLRPETIGATAQAAMSWLKPLPVTLGRLGALEVRLAQEKREVRRAQKLRYRVFYRDGTAIADAATLLARRDKDAFDKICDNLMVIDNAAKPEMC